MRKLFLLLWCLGCAGVEEASKADIENAQLQALQGCDVGQVVKLLVPNAKECGRHKIVPSMRKHVPSEEELASYECARNEIRVGRPFVFSVHRNDDEPEWVFGNGTTIYRARPASLYSSPCLYSDDPIPPSPAAGGAL